MKLKQAIDLDRKDNLKKYKSHFINSKKEIYLNGNSLGKLPIKSINKIKARGIFGKVESNTLPGSSSDYKILQIEVEEKATPICIY